MPIIEVPRGAGYFGAGFRSYRADYSFAVQGGAVSTIGLTGSTFIPSGTVILGGYMEVTSAVIGAGATAAIQINGANDVISAAAVSGAPWSTTGLKAIVPVFTVATAIKTTAARDISLVITAAVLTAGVFKVVIFAVEPMTP